MIVIIEAGLFQALGLAIFQHAQRHTALQTSDFTSIMSQTVSRSRSFGPRQAAPMQNRVRLNPPVGRGADGVQRHELVGADIGFVVALANNKSSLPGTRRS